jgi:Flp pilus assembly pilin Flp
MHDAEESTFTRFVVSGGPMFEIFRKLVIAEQGVTAIEYALIGSFIMVVIAAAVDTVGSNLNDTFATVAGDL